jgi:isopentenyl-diphosphate delta-isomerase
MRHMDTDGSAARADSYAVPAPVTGTASRKADHIRINLREDVDAKGVASGFDEYYFMNRALPELDLPQVDPGTELWGRRLAAPLMISCMVGGTEQAGRLNRVLAEVANELRLAIGVGSGRVLLEDPRVLRTFNVRAAAPEALLFANLGAVQLNKGYGVDQCRRLVDLLGADALTLHLNAVQEAVQPEGDVGFAGLLDRIADVCRRLEVPVVVKEVGWGIAPDVVRELLSAGVAAVDVAGAGGTSWSEVERHRTGEPWRARVAAAFAGWGIPTAECLRLARLEAPDARIFASGGIRGGIDVAKAVALGADLVGVAGPFLRAAADGPDAALDLGRELVGTLRVAMFSLGTRTLADLRGTPRLRCRTALREPHTVRLAYRTEEAGQFVDITDDVEAAVRAARVDRGLVHVYSQHTTAAIRINENEPLLLADFRRLLERVAPAGDGAYEHDDLTRRAGVPPDEPLNGHSHCRHLFLSSSESVPVTNGRLELGTYQRIFLIELCHARTRCVTVQVLGW